MSVLFKAHAISFSVRFQHRPQHFAHFSNLESAERFSLRNQEEQRQKYFEYVVSVHEMFVFLIGTLPALPAPQKDVTAVRPGLRGRHSVAIFDAQRTDQETCQALHE